MASRRTHAARSILDSPEHEQVLSQLVEEGGLTTIETLSHRIAALLGDTSPEGLERAKIRMHHAILPKMEDHNVIEYDSRNGDVVLVDTEEEFRPRFEALVG